MLKLELNPEKIFIFSKNSIFPALLTGIFFIYFCSVADFSEKTYHSLHMLFMVCTVLTLLIAGYFRVFVVLMTVSLIYMSCILINSLRYIYGEDYIFSAGYNIWIMLLFPNLLLIILLCPKSIVAKHWSLYYIFLLTQTLLIERLSGNELKADSYYFYKHIGMFNYPALDIAILCLFILFAYHIRKGKILSAATLFSALAVFTGIYFSDNLLAFSLFFSAAVFVEMFSLGYYLNYIRFKDEELNVANYNAYFNDAEKKYPLKYSIALMYIDDYERLLKRFGKHKMITLKKMFFERIKKINPDILIYNYKEDALILAFLNANAAESYEQTEEIRRLLVKSIFVFNESNHLQLTVSQCVSEKKRSDIDASAVLVRAEENLLKACKFTRNITIKA